MALEVWDSSRPKALHYQSYIAQVMDKLTSQAFSSLVSESQTGSVVRAAAQAKRELCSRGPFADWAKKEMKINGPKLQISQFHSTRAEKPVATESYKSLTCWAQSLTGEEEEGSTLKITSFIPAEHPRFGPS